jgi:glyoxylase-like metal-dependent hydrolase (beta-lactamase superfamily II)
MVGNSITIGVVTITALPDPGGPSVLSEKFPDVPAGAWDTFRERFPSSFPTPNGWAGGGNAWLVRTPGQTVLVDTGERPAPDEIVKGQPDRFLEALAAQGIDPQAIDVVVLTHLDGDHVGWALTTDGRPTFPEARYVVTRAEWEHAQKPESRTRYEHFGAYLDRAVLPLGKLEVLDLVEGGASLGYGLTIIDAAGHTPGHAAVHIASEGDQALLVADAFHHPAQITEPEWSSIYDNDPTTAAATRARLAEWAARERLIMGATHFLAPGFGRIVREGRQFYWSPM